MFKQQKEVQEIDYFEEQAARTNKEIEKINNECQNNSSLLVKKLDELINKLIVVVIANFNTNSISRNDLIVDIDRLLIIREKIANNYCDNRSNNNNN